MPTGTTTTMVTAMPIPISSQFLYPPPAFMYTGTTKYPNGKGGKR
jgi:hypothetical protein